jgi:hypothetical protein
MLTHAQRGVIEDDVVKIAKNYRPVRQVALRESRHGASVHLTLGGDALTNREMDQLLKDLSHLPVNLTIAPHTPAAETISKWSGGPTPAPYGPHGGRPPKWRPGVSTLGRPSTLTFFRGGNLGAINPARCDTCRVTAKVPLPVRTNLGGRSSPSQCGSRKVTR